ncbi:hypothetical protein SCG7109_AC_00380 [Chlamydiales bacterium SCGC AG-110-M15]|nr:hypothetical protein SCG7109_AC_00380 [Chlamydiales bacterium SCGC AG-110-M15]
MFVIPERCTEIFHFEFGGELSQAIDTHDLTMHIPSYTDITAAYNLDEQRVRLIEGSNQVLSRTSEIFLDRIQSESNSIRNEAVEKIRLLRRFKRSERQLEQLEMDMLSFEAGDIQHQKVLRQYYNCLNALKETASKLNGMSQSLGIRKKLMASLKPHQEMHSFMQGKYALRCQRIAQKELTKVSTLQQKDKLNHYLGKLQTRNRPLALRLKKQLQNKDSYIAVNQVLQAYWQSYSPANRNILTMDEAHSLMQDLTKRIEKRTWKARNWKKVLDALEQQADLRVVGKKI